MKKLIVTVGLLLVIPTASAQKVDHQYLGQGYIFIGPATTLGQYNEVPMTAGFGGDAFVHKGLAIGAELAYAAHDNGRGIGSANVSYRFLSKGSQSKVEPFITGGFTLFFGDRAPVPGFNLGGGVNIWVRERAALRFEVRDHENPGAPFDLDPAGGRIVAFRIGVTFR